MNSTAQGLNGLALAALFVVGVPSLAPLAAIGGVLGGVAALALLLALPAAGILLLIRASQATDRMKARGTVGLLLGSLLNVAIHFVAVLVVAIVYVGGAKVLGIAV